METMNTPDASARLLELKFLKLTETLNMMQCQIKAIQTDIREIPLRMWESIEHRAKESENQSQRDMVQLAITSFLDTILATKTKSKNENSTDSVNEMAINDPKQVEKSRNSIIPFIPTSKTPVNLSHERNEINLSIETSDIQSNHTEIENPLPFLIELEEEMTGNSLSNPDRPQRLMTLRSNSTSNVRLTPTLHPREITSLYPHEPFELSDRKRKSSLSISSPIRSPSQKMRKGMDEINKFKWSNGEIHKVPETWSLPNNNIHDMWFYWHYGDPILKIGPFFNFDIKDIKKKDKNNYFKLKKIINHFYEIGINKGYIISQNKMEKIEKKKMEIIFQKIYHEFQKNIVDNNILSSISNINDIYNCMKLNENSFLNLTKIKKIKKKKNIPTINDTIKKNLIIIKSDYRFRWKDGTYHRAPEDWFFPIIHCKKLWHYWFSGDNYIVPYRKLDLNDFNLIDSKKNYERAKKVMNGIIDISIKNNFIKLKTDLFGLNENDRNIIMEKSFLLLFNNYSLIGDIPGLLQMNLIHEYNYTIVSNAMEIVSKLN